MQLAGVKFTPVDELAGELGMDGTMAPRAACLFGWCNAVRLQCRYCRLERAVVTAVRAVVVSAIGVLAFGIGQRFSGFCEIGVILFDHGGIIHNDENVVKVVSIVIDVLPNKHFRMGKKSNQEVIDRNQSIEMRHESGDIRVQPPFLLTG